MAKRHLYGVGGWLLALIVLQCAAVPLLEAWRGYRLVADGGTLGLSMPEADPAWLLGGLVLLVVAEIALGILMARRLAWRFDPASVTWAIATLWIAALLFVVGNPAAWAVSGGLPLLYSFDLVIFVTKGEPWRFIAALGWAIGWTAYLNRSRRVENTYYYGEAQPGMEDVFA